MKLCMQFHLVFSVIIDLYRTPAAVQSVFSEVTNEGFLIGSRLTVIEGGAVSRANTILSLIAELYWIIWRQVLETHAFW